MFSCSANRTLYCKQMISSSTFKSQQTNKSYKIFHEVNCSSGYVIYIIECTLCKKQCVGKSETSFNIRLNNHHNNIEKPDYISVQKNLVFNKHAKFTITDKLKNTTKSKDILRQRLIEKENLWIQTLKTLHSKGLTRELRT